MATVVCQGLQSCLQSQILEPRTIRLKLSCSVDENSRCHYYDDAKQISSTTADDDDDDDDSHCWSFLQAISSSNNGSKLESTDKKETPIYVHPLDTRSKPTTLSDKSLELCTENLGSETGTDIIDEDIIGSSCGIFSSSSSSSSPSENGGNVIISPTREQQQQQKRAIKRVVARDFPPPLTTICGVASLRVRPHREDGRLIIKATKTPSPHFSRFQAERSHGRLRLTLFRDSDEEEIEDDIAEPSCGGEEEEEEEEIVDDFDEENDGYMGEEEDDEDEGVNGNNKDVGGKMGIKKIKRPGRCKEGETDKGLLNWEAVWVATTS